MTKYSKYLNTFFFAIAALTIYNFMTSYNLGLRYQYNDFELGFVYRPIVSVLSFGSLIFLAIQEWSSAPNKRAFIIVSTIYISIILIDMHVWIMMVQWGWAYYEIVLVHTFPILIIFSKLNINIKAKLLFFTGLAVLFIGFLFDVIFINIPYPDMTDKLFEKNIIFEKTRNMIYYIGFVSIAFGVITLVKKKLENTTAK